MVDNGVCDRNIINNFVSFIENKIKIQIDVQISEKEADLDDDDTECVEIWLDDDEIGDQTVFYLSSESDDEPIVVPMSKKVKNSQLERAQVNQFVGLPCEQ